MRYYAGIGERSFEIEVNTDDSGKLQASLDRVPHQVDLQCVDGQRLYSLMVGNRSYEMYVDEIEGQFVVTVQGRQFEVSVRDERDPVPQAKALLAADGALELYVKAPMPGMVKIVHVVDGDRVVDGAPLLILEAMKMENEIVAPREGTVTKIQVKAGQRVSQGDVLLVIS